MGEERAYRIWSQAGLQVPRKRPRKRIANSRPRPTTPTRANEVWAYDFVFDACANGQQLKCLTLVDEYTRECLAIDVAGSIRSGRLIEVLSRVISERGSPKHIRSDNGPEFVSKALLSWAVVNGLDPALIDPGKPWQNGTNESFNGKFRDECNDPVSHSLSLAIIGGAIASLRTGPRSGDLCNLRLTAPQSCSAHSPRRYGAIRRRVRQGRSPIHQRHRPRTLRR